MGTENKKVSSDASNSPQATRSIPSREDQSDGFDGESDPELRFRDSVLSHQATTRLSVLTLRIVPVRPDGLVLC